MEKVTASEALYATISDEGMVLAPRKMKIFSFSGVFLQPRYAAIATYGIDMS